MWVVSSHINLSINYKTDSKRRASRKIDESSRAKGGRGVKCRTVDRLAVEAVQNPKNKPCSYTKGQSGRPNNPDNRSHRRK